MADELTKKYSSDFDKCNNVVQTNDKNRYFDKKDGQFCEYKNDGNLGGC